MKILKNTIKILISAGLLAYLVYRAEPQKIIDILTTAWRANGFVYLAAAFFFEILAVFIMSMRWRKLLSGYRLKVKLSRLTGFYLIGLFFNNFLPTSIGGDVIRIYKVVNETSDRASGFASVIIERIMGIAATLLIAIVSLFFISQQFHSKKLMAASILLFLSIFAAFAFIIVERPFKLLLRLFDKLTFFNIGEKVNKLLEAIHYFSEKRRILLYAFLFSLASQGAIVVMNYFLALAFNIQIDFMFLAMVIPITFVLTILPSINGVGLRDLGFVGLLARVGVSNAAALSMSFMNLIIPMMLSIAGAVLFVVQKRNSKGDGYDVLKTSS